MYRRQLSFSTTLSLLKSVALMLISSIISLLSRFTYSLYARVTSELTKGKWQAESGNEWSATRRKIEGNIGSVMPNFASLGWNRFSVTLHYGSTPYPVLPLSPATCHLSKHEIGHTVLIHASKIMNKNIKATVNYVFVPNLMRLWVRIFCIEETIKKKN